MEMCTWAFLGGTSERSTVYSHMKSHHNYQASLQKHLFFFLFSHVWSHEEEACVKKYHWGSTGPLLPAAAGSSPPPPHSDGRCCKAWLSGAQNKSINQSKCVFPTGSSLWSFTHSILMLNASFPLSWQIMRSQKFKKKSPLKHSFFLGI